MSGETTTSNTYTLEMGGLNTSFTGSVETRDFIQFAVIKDGEIYINYDTFTWLIVTIFLILLLQKTLIKAFVESFKITFNNINKNKIGKK